MELAPDRYRFVLDRPIDSEPGTRWAHCGGATRGNATRALFAADIV